MLPWLWVAASAIILDTLYLPVLPDAANGMAMVPVFQPDFVFMMILPGRTLGGNVGRVDIKLLGDGYSTLVKQVVGGRMLFLGPAIGLIVTYVCLALIHPRIVALRIGIVVGVVVVPGVLQAVAVATLEHGLVLFILMMLPAIVMVMTMRYRRDARYRGGAEQNLFGVVVHSHYWLGNHYRKRQPNRE